MVLERFIWTYWRVNARYTGLGRILVKVLRFPVQEIFYRAHMDFQIVFSQHLLTQWKPTLGLSGNARAIVLCQPRTPKEDTNVKKINQTQLIAFYFTNIVKRT